MYLCDLLIHSSLYLLISYSSLPFPSSLSPLATASFNKDFY